MTSIPTDKNIGDSGHVEDHHLIDAALGDFDGRITTVESVTQGLGPGGGLTPVGPATTVGTLTPGTLQLVDATTGQQNWVIPLSQAPGTAFQIEKSDNTVNTVALSTSGTEVFQDGTTQQVMTQQGDGLSIVRAASGVWYFTELTAEGTPSIFALQYDLTNSDFSTAHTLDGAVVTASAYYGLNVIHSATPVSSVDWYIAGSAVAGKLGDLPADESSGFWTLGVSNALVATSAFSAGAELQARVYFTDGTSELVTANFSTTSVSAPTFSSGPTFATSSGGAGSVISVTGSISGAPCTVQLFVGTTSGAFDISSAPQSGGKTNTISTSFTDTSGAAHSYWYTIVISDDYGHVVDSSSVQENTNTGTYTTPPVVTVTLTGSTSNSLSLNISTNDPTTVSAILHAVTNTDGGLSATSHNVSFSSLAASTTYVLTGTATSSGGTTSLSGSFTTAASGGGVSGNLATYIPSGAGTTVIPDGSVLTATSLPTNVTRSGARFVLAGTSGTGTVTITDPADFVGCDKVVFVGKFKFLRGFQNDGGTTGAHMALWYNDVVNWVSPTPPVSNYPADGSSHQGNPYIAGAGTAASIGVRTTGGGTTHIMATNVHDTMSDLIRNDGGTTYFQGGRCYASAKVHIPAGTNPVTHVAYTDSYASRYYDDHPDGLQNTSGAAFFDDFVMGCQPGVHPAAAYPSVTLNSATDDVNSLKPATAYALGSNTHMGTCDLYWGGDSGPVNGWARNGWIVNNGQRPCVDGEGTAAGKPHDVTSLDATNIQTWGNVVGGTYGTIHGTTSQSGCYAPGSTHPATVPSTSTTPPDIAWQNANPLNTYATWAATNL